MRSMLLPLRRLDRQTLWTPRLAARPSFVLQAPLLEQGFLLQLRLRGKRGGKLWAGQVASLSSGLERWQALS